MIEKRIKEIRDSLNKNVELVAVSKTKSNKIKYMAPYVDLVHGIDSLKSVKILNKEAKKNNRIIKCLLQLKISEEFTKFGLSEKEIELLLNSINILGLKNISVVGIMTIGSFTNNMSIVVKEFDKTKKIFDNLKSTFPSLKILSMGMSNDYKIAIKHGSNMIRVGSLIFGKRI